jgi:hypothetical protein
MSLVSFITTCHNNTDFTASVPFHYFETHAGEHSGFADGCCTSHSTSCVISCTPLTFTYFSSARHFILIVFHLSEDQVTVALKHIDGGLTQDVSYFHKEGTTKADDI